MEYTYDNTPSPEEFRKLGKKEVRAFEKWFLSTLDDRIQTFEAFVRSYSSYKNWKADYTFDSVKSLGEWFYERAEENIPVAEFVPLSRDSENMAFAVGVYLSCIILKGHPAMGWYFEANRTRDASYGQPYIGPICNDFYIDITTCCKVCMIQMAENRLSSDDFPACFKMWYDEYEEWN